VKRCQVLLRPEWKARVEAQGLLFHSVQEKDYWGEGTYYALAPGEVSALESATGALHEMCLEAAQHVIEQRRYADLGIPPSGVSLIEETWEREPPSLYGRMDLALGEDGVPKLLEYNADTPTSLLEAAVIQWTWLLDCFPSRDQFNSIHERLIRAWRDMRPHLPGQVAHFGSVDELEDQMTVGYLRDTAEQAGLTTVGLDMTEVGWDSAGRQFVDLERVPIRSLFKLYPWEGLLTDEFGSIIPQAKGTLWIEPAWKMLLSSKGILPVLWELFPGHPNLLPASPDVARLSATGWVRKPLHGREGSNVTVEAPGVRVATGGPYTSEGFVYQGYADLGAHDGWRPVVGSWVIAGEAAGIGIRETRGYVTDNTARFVPHAITP
jgi:glutathionylspermidine synthase